MKTDGGLTYEDYDSFRWTDLIIGICFFFALIGIGLFLAVNFRPFYYWSISAFNIEEESGFSRDEIIENYDTLIDYCSPFYTGELNFPTFRSSVSGLSHFAECKTLFNFFYILGFIGIVVCVFFFIMRHRDEIISHLRVCAIMSIGIPVILVFISLINFDWLFLLFHKIAFDNDDWLFDPNLDQVIRILPEGFFMVCLLVIAFTVITGAAVVFIIYLMKRKKMRKGDEPLPKPQNFYYTP